MRVRFSNDAENDLRGIVRWIGNDNPPRARSFGAELRAACGSLSRHHGRYPVVLARQGNAIHKQVHGRYLIFYRVCEADVEILRIVHGARDWAAILGE